MTITVTDLFCGAGGSALGAHAIPGVRVVMAANHWQMAIDTHQENFPDTAHDCFVAGTLVLTASGQRPIEDIAPGELVLTHRGRWRPVVRKFAKRDRTVRMRSALHAAGTEVTPNHEFWTRTSTLRVAGNDYEREYGAAGWRPIGEARVDRVRRVGHRRDMIAYPVSFGELPWQDPEGLLGDTHGSWWLIGRWLGDGSSGERNGDVTIVCGRDEAEELRGRVPSAWREREVRTGHQFYDYDRKLATWLREHFGSGAAGKNIPGWVLTMPADRRRALLEGYVSADGSAARGTTRVTTVSRPLALGVRMLAHSLGYVASLHLSDRSGPCVIEGRTVQRRAAWTVQWRETPTRRNTMLDEFHRWAYVQDIDELDDEVDVFTMEVAEDHSYIADGMVVKNCADISQARPQRYPRTDILWASPECVNHSIAKGRRRVTAQQDMLGETLPDEAADRSRATMWDVPRFAEHHLYDAVIVENVVDAARWIMFPAWLHAMRLLGYRHKVVYLNSMHAPAMAAPRAPQSRDRLYVVFTRDGNRVPDLDVRPLAWCPVCENEVRAVQWWKRGETEPWGRYRSQYLYRCPNAGCRHSVVEPYVDPAAAAIDWSLPGQRIGDRARPLSVKTLARIEAGLRRYARPMTFEARGNTFVRNGPDGRPAYARAWPVDEPTATLTATETRALVVPVEGRDGKFAQPVEQPLRTQTARLESALVVPSGGTWNETAQPASDPFRARTATESDALVVPYYGTGVARPASEPLPTQSTVDRFGLAFVAELRGGSSDARPVLDPLATVTASGNHHGLVEPPEPQPAVEDCAFRMLEPREIQAAMAFRPDYRVLGTRREQVRQLGNGVTPPAAEFLLRSVVDSLGGAA